MGALSLLLLMNQLNQLYRKKNAVFPFFLVFCQQTLVERQIQGSLRFTASLHMHKMLRLIGQDRDATHALTHMLDTVDVCALIASCHAWHAHARARPPRLFGGLATRIGRASNTYCAWFSSSTCRQCPDQAVGIMVLEKGVPPAPVTLLTRWVPGLERGTCYLEITLAAVLPEKRHVVDCLVLLQGDVNTPRVLHKHGRLHPDTTNDDMIMERVQSSIKFTNVPGTLECAYRSGTREIVFRDSAHPELFITVGTPRSRTITYGSSPDK